MTHLLPHRLVLAVVLIVVSLLQRECGGTASFAAAPATTRPPPPCRLAHKACTFFVSNSSPNASDANSGTNPSAPLATIGAAVLAGPMAGLQPGDSLLLHRGDVWQLDHEGVVLPGCVANTTDYSDYPSSCICSSGHSAGPRVTLAW